MPHAVPQLVLEPALLPKNDPCQIRVLGLAETARDAQGDGLAHAEDVNDVGCVDVVADRQEREPRVKGTAGKRELLFTRGV